MEFLSIFLGIVFVLAAAVGVYLFIFSHPKFDASKGFENTSIAPSSTPASSCQSRKYDVFLSFRGEDTRKTFVDHLYSELDQHLISVYKDDEKLPRGDSIDPSLFRAIEESQIAVIVFSKNYAESSWCLEELAHIMKCKDERDLTVIPVFYDVEPTEVRNQKGRFGEAFAKQKAKTRAKIWRKALVEVSNISGWETKNTADGHESKFIKKVVDSILDRLLASVTCVDEDLVGMRARLQDLKPLLDIRSDSILMVGIWGIGGGGKTTLANSIYMEISQHFQGCHFVENVREKSKDGLNKLQENILTAILKKEVKIHSVEEGKRKMKSLLHKKKVLILLDDVDELDQLEALAGKKTWFGSGSRIIITTRNEHLLRKVDRIYPIRLLSDDEAIQLFKIHAYNEEVPIKDYETLSSRVVSYAAGLPLAIKVLGSFLYDKNNDEWISALDKLECIPDPTIMNILKVSYDGLELYQQELFLDIACFYRRTHSYWSRDKLEACGFHPIIGIKVLVQKAFITIVDGKFDMHDLLQELGHNIVNCGHPNNPEKHSRLWIKEKIESMSYRDEMMEYNTEAILMFGRLNIASSGVSKMVSKMRKLRLLIIDEVTYDTIDKNDEGPTFLSNELRYIRWLYYPSSSFPHSFRPTNLVVLKLFGSMQKELWKDFKHLPNLEVLDLESMVNLLSTPNFDGLPRLKRLTLDGCRMLEEIHSSFENHHSLEYLRVTWCLTLKMIPTIRQMKNIKVLVMNSCSLKDGDVPCGIDELLNLQELNLSRNSFSRLDFSLSQLTQLKVLDVSFCENLVEIPELPSSLAVLNAHECMSLTVFVEDFYKNCKQLCQVTLKDGEWSESLLQVMLKGNAIENGSLFLLLEGLRIPRGLTLPLRRGNRCRLELPENWCNDFSGFLITFVSDVDHLLFFSSYLRMKQVSGKDFEDYRFSYGMDMDFVNEGVWEEEEESDGMDMDSRNEEIWAEESDDEKGTSVWYISFGLLRHTAWWDQTYKSLLFEIENNPLTECSGLGVSLVEEKKSSGLGVGLVEEKKSRSGQTESLANYSSPPHYNPPKIKIKYDSTSQLDVSLEPYIRN